MQGITKITIVNGQVHRARTVLPITTGRVTDWAQGVIRREWVRVQPMPGTDDTIYSATSGSVQVVSIILGASDEELAHIKFGVL